MSDTSQNLKVLSPLKGWCTSLDDSPDAVFRDRILGEGVSIDPTAGEVRAPFEAKVLTVPDSYHALNLRAENGVEFLIHIGIDSVKMAGDGFKSHVKQGDRVASGQLLLSFDLEKVLRGAASLKSPVLMLHSDDHEVIKLRPSGLVNFGEALCEVRPSSSEQQAVDVTTNSPSTDTAGNNQLESIVKVGLEHGIHARPAATLITAIKNLDVNLFIHLGEHRNADARSAVALMSLGVSYGDVITIKAHGKDGKTAIDAVTKLLEPLQYDPQAETVSARKQDQTEAKETVPPADGTVIRAQPASPGLGIGNAFCLGALDHGFSIDQGSSDDENKSLSVAIEKVRTHLQKLADSGSDTRSEIATAHLALLEDPLIVGAAKQAIAAGESAARAWHQAVDNAVETLRAVDDGRMRERIDDLVDINLRVQRALSGEEQDKGPEMSAGTIVIAENLLPSQLLELDPQRVRGICLAAGGVTSHVAILAISLNLPMLVAAGQELLAIEDGSRLLVDAEFGELQVNPDHSTRIDFETRIEAEKTRRQTELDAALDECRTRDDKRILIHANLTSAVEASEAVAAGAEGCGLLRTEFIYMGKTRAPGLDEQVGIYQEISAALGPRPMVVRILDAGGDKPISYIDQQTEENPALGVRGIRLGLNNLNMLETQLAAFLQLHHQAPLQVMIPMVSSVHEVYAVQKILEKIDPVGDKRTRIRLGVMIETPAAALIADRLAEIVDFFSIGTNDLTQYTLCMDRGEPQLAVRLDTLHPAVLTLIKLTADAANKANIPVAVCGAAAGDLLVSPVLIGLGVHELSMPKSLIARQKARLRLLSMRECEQAANECLEMDSAREVRAHMRKFMTAK